MTVPSTITLSLESYEALIALAQKSTINADGTVDQQASIVLSNFLQEIETDNGITRSTLYIRWQDPTAPLPPGVRFPDTWPPTLQYLLQLLSRPISKADVMTVVQAKTAGAVNIMVTPDPAGLVGWTKIDDYFINS